MDKTRVFIAYKKELPNGEKNTIPFELKQVLEDTNKFTAFMDSYLHLGEAWEPTLYRELISAHVLIVAVSPNISESMWVRREISIAKAFGLRVIPIGINVSETDLSREVDALGLSEIQYNLRTLTFNSQTAGSAKAWLTEPLLNARESIESKGRPLLDEIVERVQNRPSPAQPMRSVASRDISFGSVECKVHIAAGDLFLHGSYDIIVNSENSLLQMARLMDGRSVSAQLRYMGSGNSPDTYDAIQREIEQLALQIPRPAQPGVVVVTSSGDPQSILWSGLQTKYLFHVVSTNAIPGEVGIKAFTENYQLNLCMRRVFDQVRRLKEESGVVSPPGTKARKLQESEASQFNVSSIVLPIFGTGRGGQPTSVVAPVLLSSLKSYLTERSAAGEPAPIENIHFAAFFESDVSDLKTAMEQVFD